MTTKRPTLVLLNGKRVKIDDIIITIMIIKVIIKIRVTEKKGKRIIIYSS